MDGLITAMFKTQSLGDKKLLAICADLKKWNKKHA
jgi:hypothetical protein